MNDIVEKQCLNMKVDSKNTKEYQSGYRVTGRKGTAS